MSVRNAQGNNRGYPGNIIEPTRKGNNRFAIYNNGFYNIGVTLIFFDIGRGGQDSTGGALLSSSRQRLFRENRIMKIPFPILGGSKIPVKIEDRTKIVCKDENHERLCNSE